MDLEEMDLYVYAYVIDGLEQCPSREQKIAALRTFVRGVMGYRPLEGDLAMLEVIVAPKLTIKQG